MGESTTIINTGLRGVTVASTRISDVDGKKGRLIYRGFLVSDLAERASFEEVVYLLLYEHLPDRKELAQFKDRLASERWISDSLVAALKTQPAEALPMILCRRECRFWPTKIRISRNNRRRHQSAWPCASSPSSRFC